MYNTTIKDAWNSPQLVKIRRRHQEMKWYDVGICSQCSAALLDSSGSV
jgi:hypothetical protein